MPSPQLSTDRRVRGFTLIELLVVIAIIAILAAMIFPAVSTVKGKANQTKCLQMVKQWAQVIPLYAGDHQQQIEWGGVFSVSTAGGPYQPYFTGPGMQINNRWCQSVPWDKTNNGNPPVCYAMTRPTLQGGPVKTSYSMMSMAHPASFLVLIEGNGKQEVGQAAAGTFEEVVKPLCINTDKKQIRHSGYVNMLFGDFHVTSDTWANIEKNFPVWCTLDAP